MRARTNRGDPIVPVSLDQVRIAGMIVRMYQRSEVGFSFEMLLRHPLEIHRKHYIAIYDKELFRKGIQRLQKGTSIA